VTWLAVLRPVGAGLGLEILNDRENSLRTASTDDCFIMLSGVFTADVAPPSAEGHAAWLATAYNSEGTQLFARLRGRFVFVVIDRAKAVSFVVRDPMGEHPAFYGVLDGSVCLAPKAEIVARANARRPALDQVAAAAFLLRVPTDAHRTLFEGVDRLLQGHVLEVRRSGVGARRYWMPRPAGTIPYDQARFTNVLGRAVDRLVHDRAGVFLSGGLDSALVAASLSDRTEDLGLPKPVALSLAFRGTPADEEVTQRAVAARLGFDQIVCTPDELVPAGLVESSLAVAAHPLSQPPELLEGAYEELAKRGREAGCSTIVGGSGGDEWLMPPTGFAADSLLRLDVSALFALIRGSSRYWPNLQPASATWFILWHSALRPLLRSAISTAEDRLRLASFTRARFRRSEARIPPWVAPAHDIRDAVVEGAVAATAPAPVGHAASTERSGFLDSGYLSAAWERAFDLERRTGLTSPAPLLDPDVVDFLCAIAPRALVEGGRVKAPARDILSSRFPDLADSWPRTVYGNALWSEAIRRDGARAWLRADGVGALVATGLVEPRGLEGVLRNEFPASPAEMGAAWRALSLDAWLQGIENRQDAL
jgi:asparagine synthase (glutamine-hydrolysing)